MPGTRFSPVVPVASRSTRSGRIVIFDAPRVSASPSPAINANSPSVTRHPPVPCPSAVPSIRFDTPRKSATYAVARLLVDLLRRTHLLDLPLRHHRDAVRHREGFLLVVRDVDERDADLFLQRLQLDLQALAELGVQGAERLVQQQHGGVQDQRARQRDALLLTAGELRRAPLREPAELHQLERATHPLLRLLLGRLLVAEAERHVLLHRQVREQRVVLEHRVDVALVRRGLRHVHAVQQDLPLGRPLEARDHPQARGLAAARRAEQREELAGRHLQVDPGDRGEIAEALHQIDELYLSSGHRPRSILRGRVNGSSSDGA